MSKSNVLKLAAVMTAAAIGAGTLASCSKADRAAFNNLGQEAKVKVYSGGKLVYEGVSKGKIENEGQSNGYYFEDKCVPGDNKLVEVEGVVIITRNDLTCPAVREPAYLPTPKAQ